jgi:glycosyltransferase involved in cell wall biosynthesis
MMRIKTRHANELANPRLEVLDTIVPSGTRPDIDSGPSARAASADTEHLRFSVVIPAFNESAYLADALMSLSRQDFDGDYEVIVVDNHSDDGTAAIARLCGATVVCEEEPGVCAARQRGTQHARGEIVVSTDADTIFDPSWLSSINRFFTRNPRCVAVAGPCRFVDGPWWACYAAVVFVVVSTVYRLTGRVLYVSATNVAFRKSAWTGYDTKLTQGGDELDLLRRLRTRGHVAFEPNNPTFTSSRRLHEGLVYNIFVTCLFHYFFSYLVNRIAGRQLLGTAPPFRDRSSRRGSWWRPFADLRGVTKLAGVAAVLVVFALSQISF